MEGDRISVVEGAIALTAEPPVIHSQAAAQEREGVRFYA
jgi:hypothetical protein